MIPVCFDPDRALLLCTRRSCCGSQAAARHATCVFLFGFLDLRHAGRLRPLAVALVDQLLGGGFRLAVFELQPSVALGDACLLPFNDLAFDPSFPPLACERGGGKCRLSPFPRSASASDQWHVRLLA